MSAPNSKKEIGIAVSVFEKLEQLRFVVDTVRSSWTTHNDAHISVCCNSERAIDDVRKIEGIDAVVPGNFLLPASPKPRLRQRQFDCISRSTISAGVHARFVVHHHADACAATSTGVISVVDMMKKKGSSVAYRGRGIDFRSEKTPYGDVDDHFLFFDSTMIDLEEFFKCDAADELTRCNVESLLASRITASTSPDKVLHYSTMASNIVGPGMVDRNDYYIDSINHRAMNPYNFDKERMFLHAASLSDIKAFLGNDVVFDTPPDDYEKWLAS